jgi:parallel beta-helix repeat protein
MLWSQTKKPLAVLALCIVGIAASSTMAGDLNPPPGPVAPTPKSLKEIEPRVVINAANTPGDGDSVFLITQSGSYYLDRNLEGIDSFHGIKIAADAVTVDLNGFSLIGVPNSLAAISVSGSRRAVTVMNGTVTNWVQRGLDLRTAAHSHVESVNAFSNGIDGIALGQYCIIERCTAAFNVALGISAANDCVIRNCVADQNGAGGILAAEGSRFESCVASSNTGHGFNCLPGATLNSCTARSNTSDGVRFEGPAVIVHCESESNSGFGLVEVPSGSGASILGCTASRNGEVGIQSSGTIQSCTAYMNAGSGFQLDGGSILNCVAKNNSADGIVAHGSSLVRENQCTGNGVGAAIAGAGIRVSGFDCRVMGNNVISNDYGIWASTPGNLIYGNSASSNTSNYEAVPNNRFGIIVTAPVSGIVTGNAGAAGLGSTDPWVNFVY